MRWAALIASLVSALTIAQTTPTITFSPTTPTSAHTITARLDEPGCGGGAGTVAGSTISIYSAFGCPGIVPVSNPQTAVFGPLATGNYQVTWYIGYPYTIATVATATLIVSDAGASVVQGAPFLGRGAMLALALMLTIGGGMTMRSFRKY
jgi:hypothetical protein